MKSKALLLALAVTFLGVAKVNSDVDGVSSDSVQQEEASVYAFHVNSEYVKKDTKLIVLRDQTSRGVDETENRLRKRLRDSLKQIQQETIEDFIARNGRSWGLNKNPAVQFKVKHVLISRKVETQVFQGRQGWQVFYARYPDSRGIITLSRVGFSKDQTQAILYVENQSHGRTGSGYYVLFRKRGEKWEEVARSLVWLS